jgi:hypothetical protein
MLGLIVDVLAVAGLCLAGFLAVCAWADWEHREHDD